MNAKQKPFPATISSAVLLSQGIMAIVMTQGFIHTFNIFNSTKSGDTPIWNAFSTESGPINKIIGISGPTSQIIYALGPTGMLYIIDAKLNQIKKIQTKAIGVVTTFHYTSIYESSGYNTPVLLAGGPKGLLIYNVKNQSATTFLLNQPVQQILIHKSKNQTFAYVGYTSGSISNINIYDLNLLTQVGTPIATGLFNASIKQQIWGCDSYFNILLFIGLANGGLYYQNMTTQLWYKTSGPYADNSPISALAFNFESTQSDNPVIMQGIPVLIIGYENGDINMMYCDGLDMQIISLASKDDWPDNYKQIVSQLLFYPVSLNSDPTKFKNHLIAAGNSNLIMLRSPDGISRNFLRHDISPLIIQESYNVFSNKSKNYFKTERFLEENTDDLCIHIQDMKMFLEPLINYTYHDCMLQRKAYQMTQDNSQRLLNPEVTSRVEIEELMFHFSPFKIRKILKPYPSATQIEYYLTQNILIYIGMELKDSILDRPPTKIILLSSLKLEYSSSERTDALTYGGFDISNKLSIRLTYDQLQFYNIGVAAGSYFNPVLFYAVNMF